MKKTHIYVLIDKYLHSLNISQIYKMHPLVYPLMKNVNEIYSLMKKLYRCDLKTPVSNVAE